MGAGAVGVGTLLYGLLAGGEVGALEQRVARPREPRSKLSAGVSGQGDVSLIWSENW